MTIEERKLHIAIQLANNAISILSAQLADRMEEVEILRVRVSELEALCKSAQHASPPVG
jgi:hypothetical protein